MKRRVFLRASERAYALFLHLLPASFRAQHGADMKLTFGARLAEAARQSVWRASQHIAREILDVVKTALRLSRRERSDGTRDGRFSGLDLDIRHAVRLWARRPVHTAFALLIIALGVGATSAIFTLVDSVMFRPLPHREPDRLVTIWQTMKNQTNSRLPVSLPNLEDWRADPSSGFEDIAAFQRPSRRTVTLAGDPESLIVARVSGNVFGLLGNAAIAGRVIGPAEDHPGRRVAVLSHGLWQTRYGGDPAVIGRTLQITGEPWEIIGVMPREFVFPSPVDFWIPLGLDPAEADRDLNFLETIGRLSPGVSLEEATLRMQAVMERLVAAYPAENEGKSVRLDFRRDLIIGDVAPAMRVLLGAVALLLVLACASVANLLLARMSSRHSELAVRGALGAGRKRILSQLVLESVLLALLGGLLGLAVAYIGTKLLVAWAPDSLPRRYAIALDMRSVLFAFGVTILSGLIFGVLPALRASRRDAAESLRQGARGTTGASGQRMLRLLVVLQIATTVVLLVGGGLLVRSFNRLASINPGFEPEGVFTLRVGLPRNRYETDEQARTFFTDLLQRASDLPGIQSAGAIWALPFGGDWASGRVTVEGDPKAPGSEPVPGLMPVLGDYFETMGMRRIAGRLFEPADFTDSTWIVVINESAARLLWHGGDAVGRRFKRGAAGEDLPWVTVVGVVADAMRFELEGEAEPELYWPWQLQSNWARDMNLVLRVAGDPVQVAAPLRQILREMDPELATSRTALLSDLVAARIALPRFRTLIVAAFALSALLLSLAGIYGVMAFAVTQRTREIGVRMALGAERGRVLGEVLWQGGRVIAAGLAVGLIGALFATQALSQLLFQVRAFDLVTWIAACLLLAMTALAACWLPARRASHIEPVIAMRD